MPHDPTPDQTRGQDGCDHGRPDPGRGVDRVLLPAGAADPILIEVTRGGMVESIHRGRAIVVHASGGVEVAFGDTGAPVYPRSANKSLQALPVVESGAAAAFAMTDAELALACASHGGEEMHTRTAGGLLARIGLTQADLECGTHAPYHVPTWEAMLARGERPTPLHNNCSGKHTAMLATAVHRGEATRGYVGYSHPVQQRILGVMEQITGQDLSRAPWGVDGCSIPTIGLPLEALAFAMARLADPVDLPAARAEAAARITRAWAAHPAMVGGTGTFDTTFMQTVKGRILIKAGAEGVCCAVVPEAGLGLALKIDDGAGRAAGPATAAILHRLGVIGDAEWEALRAIVNPPILNRKDFTCGTLRAAAF
ncbi:MAG: hypothetical protein RLY86_2161 [Pseudomonadota bacterium]|jgi:L-asparaginase II